MSEPRWIQFGLPVAMLLVFAYAFYDTWGLPALARYFPLFLSLVGVPFAVAELVRMSLKQRGNEPTRSRPDDGKLRRRRLRILAWLLGYVLAVALVGYLLASAVFLLAFLGVEARLRLVVAIPSAAVCLAVIYALGEGMNMRWP